MKSLGKCRLLILTSPIYFIFLFYIYSVVCSKKSCLSQEHKNIISFTHLFIHSVLVIKLRAASRIWGVCSTTESNASLFRVVHKKDSKYPFPKGFWVLHSHEDFKSRLLPLGLPSNLAPGATATHSYSEHLQTQHQTSFLGGNLMFGALSGTLGHMVYTDLDSQLSSITY